MAAVPRTASTAVAIAIVSLLVRFVAVPLLTVISIFDFWIRATAYHGVVLD
jgi:hypothetical protein